MGPVVRAALTTPATGAISSSYGHKLYLAPDGRVWAWGDGAPLGDGLPASIARNYPVLVSNLTSVAAISAGLSHSLALRTDGTVWAWGSANQGNLGHGSSWPDALVPQQITTLSGVIAISAKTGSLALKSDGTVWQWGPIVTVNGDQSALTPVQVSGLTDVVAISAGGSHRLAVRSDGTVWAWGSNSYGQLGDGTTTARPSPVQVPGLANIVSVEAGDGFSFAVRNDGAVWAWGSNYLGELGDGTTTQQLTPTPVPALSQVTRIRTASIVRHVFALRSDGSVWSWGEGSAGQLGDGQSVDQRLTPAPIPTLSGVVDISAGVVFGLALLGNQQIKGWGYDQSLALGDGIPKTRSVPTQLTGLTGVAKLDRMASHTLALKTDGTVWRLGYVPHQTLFPGATMPFTQIAGLSNVTAIAAGQDFGVALRSDGTVWTWGENQFGQLGGGEPTARQNPQAISSLNNIVAIAAGRFFALALRSDGTVWAWGENTYGQRGNGATGPGGGAPNQVIGLTGVTAIASANLQSFAVRNDGTLWFWGGEPTVGYFPYLPIAKPTPAMVPGIDGVVSVSAGSSSDVPSILHVGVIRNDGSVWRWRWTPIGTLLPPDPMTLAGPNTWASIDVSANLGLALRPDGTVWSWGFGFIGTDRITGSIPVTQVALVSGVSHVMSSEFINYAVKNDGTVWAWGNVTVDSTGAYRSMVNPTPIPLIPPGSPDLRLILSWTGTFAATPGKPYTVPVFVDNVSITNMPGPVPLTVTLPPQVTYMSASGTGWNCTPSGQTVNCSYPGAVAAKTALPVLNIQFIPLPSAWPSISIHGALHHPLDLILENNTYAHPAPVAKTSAVGVFRSGFFWLQDVDANQQFNLPPDRAFAFGGVPGDVPITGDWNGDGRSKVGVYRTANGLFILDYDGDGQFSGADKVYNLGVGVEAADVPVVGDWNGDGRTKVGLFRQGYYWILDANGNGAFEASRDRAFAFGGVAGDKPVMGDWNADGISDVGLFRLGFFWILDSNGTWSLDAQDATFAFGGIAGDVPVVGDWNGDRYADVGVFRQGFFWVLDGNGSRVFEGTGPGQDLAFPFGGIAGDKPILGAW